MRSVATLLGVSLARSRSGGSPPGRTSSVWTGDPFELSSRAETVIVRGQVMPGWTRQQELFERYRSPEDAPRPAYDLPGH